MNGKRNFNHILAKWKYQLFILFYEIRLRNRIPVNTIEIWVTIIFETKLYNIFREIWSPNYWF